MLARADSYPNQKWSAPSIISHSLGSGTSWQNPRKWLAQVKLSLLPEIRSFGLWQSLSDPRSNIDTGGETAAKALIRLSSTPAEKAKTVEIGIIDIEDKKFKILTQKEVEEKLTPSA